MSAAPNPPMPTAGPTPLTAAARPRAWLREPLLHFVLAGLALFAADHWLSADQDDARAIVMDQRLDDELRGSFERARGHAPDAQQMEALRQRWLDNEVLYREGLALKVDRGDATIRERVIFKALNIVEADLKAPTIDEAGLKAWFTQHRARYDEPERLDFQEAVLAQATEADVRRFVHELNTDTGDTRAGLRVFQGRPQANVVDSYGAAFATALRQAPEGQWQALQGRDGWRAVRLTHIAAGQPAEFGPLRDRIYQDWLDQTMSELRTAAVRQRLAGYSVQREAASPEPATRVAQAVSQALPPVAAAEAAQPASGAAKTGQVTP